MLIDLLKTVDNVYLAYGVTDFRMQTSSLCSIVKETFGKNPYDRSAYIFCNKRRNSIRILCYDKNGFVLAQKTLLDAEKMKFQWPRNSREMKSITKKQLEWLLSGLKIEQINSFKEFEINSKNVAY